MFDWKSLVKTVAPVLGTALGGPMAGAATKFIADKFLGNPDASEKEIADALMSSSPEQLIKLKELDNTFAIEMKRLDVDVYRIDAEDRHSARNRQILTKDNTPTILAYLSLLLFAGVTYIFHLDNWTEIEKYIWFNMLQLETIVFTYFYGSSNKEKSNGNN